MGLVNRYEIKLNQSVTGYTINIPINLEFTPIDQSELIESEFVSKEIENSINPIVDYEIVRFSPINNNNENLSTINYRLNFLGNKTHYGQIGFTEDDINFRRNNFLKSHLILDFYDSPIITKQNYLFSSTLFCRTKSSMYNLDGTIKNINTDSNLLTKFILENPITLPDGVSEGYYIYNYKSDVPKEIYMRATFNNAKTGVAHKFMTVNTPQTIDNLVNYLHVKYTLTNNENGYYYKIGNGSSSLYLYEINVI